MSKAFRVKFDDGGRAAAGFKGYAGDCATRSAAIVTGLPYRDVYAALNLAAKRERPRAGTTRSSARNGVFRVTFGAWLETQGFLWVPTMTIGSGCRVHLAVGELPAKGRFVIRVSKHFTALVDGVIHDDHDPGRDGKRCVYGYWMRATP